MMDFPELYKYNIFPIPFVKSSKDLFLVYAPLTGDIFFSKKKFLDICENELKSGSTISAKDFAQLLSNCQKAELPRLSTVPEALQQLDIILNFKCNFACSYCFSAQGRSNGEIVWSVLQTALTHFLGEKSTFNIEEVVFTGGGEPLLSFDLLKKAVLVIKGSGRNIAISTVTNGSLLTEKIVDFFMDNNIGLVVSFEILRELQDLQRNHYDLCLQNIRMAIRKGCIPGLRVTITPASVFKLQEMVEELHRSVPEIKSFAAEVVMAPELFEKPEELGDFYKNFIEQFSISRKKAKNFGMEIFSTSFMAVDGLKARMCPGKLCITPDGNLTNCARVSSSLEKNADAYFYGKCDSKDLSIDYKKFADHTHLYSMKNHSECDACWAKWNCGGGCARIRESFSEAFFSAYCTCVKGCILQEIIDRLEDSCEANGTSLQEYLSTVGEGYNE